MKYNGFYFWLFSKPMKQMLSEKYNRQYAHDIMKKKQTDLPRAGAKSRRYRR